LDPRLNDRILVGFVGSPNKNPPPIWFRRDTIQAPDSHKPPEFALQARIRGT